MPIFNCEIPALKSVLIQLYKLITENGGYLHDSVTVLEKEGELSILSDLPEDNHDEIITIPDSCLPRTDDFVFTAQKDKIIAEVKSDKVIKSHVVAMELMIEIYNITNKLEKHRHKDIWLVLRDAPELMEKIFESRAKATKIIEYYEKYKKGEFDDLLLETFMVTRRLGFRISGKEKLSPCLMPFIDFVNHSHASPSYQQNASEIDALSVINSKPVQNSKECFVSYGFYDSLDCMVLYDFPDINAPHVRSIPLKYDFHVYGSIQIDTQIADYYSGSLPDSVQDLRLYMPRIVGLERDVMHLSHIIIPGDNARWALRRALDFLVKSWKPQLKPAVMKDIIINFEKYIIKKNVEYYQSLSDAVDDLEVGVIPDGFRDSLNSLIEVQLNKLQRYQQRMHEVDKSLSNTQ